MQWGKWAHSGCRSGEKGGESVGWVWLHKSQRREEGGVREEGAVEGGSGVSGSQGRWQLRV